MEDGLCLTSTFITRYELQLSKYRYVIRTAALSIWKRYYVDCCKKCNLRQSKRSGIITLVNDNYIDALESCYTVKCMESGKNLFLDSSCYNRVTRSKSCCLSKFAWYKCKISLIVDRENLCEN